MYPDTRSTEPAITAEEFAEGANAPPKLMVVNPQAAIQMKPKIQVAKKANILASLPTQAPQQAQQAPPQHSPAHSSSPPSSQLSPAARPTAVSTPQRSPRIDDDMGIVRVENKGSSSGSGRQSQTSSRRGSSPENAPNPMIPKQQVALRSRAERDDGGSMTAGQRRAAAELERIKRDQARTTTDDVESSPPYQRDTSSSRMSVTSTQGSTVGPGPSEVSLTRYEKNLHTTNVSSPKTWKNCLVI